MRRAFEWHALLARLFRRWRLELAIAVGFVAARSLLVNAVGAGTAEDLVLLMSVAALTVPAARRRLLSSLVDARRYRRWESAFLAVAEDNPPRILGLVRFGAGERALARVGPGATVAELDRASDALAAFFGVREVRVRRHPRHAGVAQVSALKVDPLSAPTPPWPWLGADATSLWHPVPVGVDEDGGDVHMTLFEHNLLLGGEPGAGKSGVMSLLVAAAALDPTATLWLMDGKLVELAPWRRVATRFAGVEIDGAIDLLRMVRAQMDIRFRHLLETGRRKVAEGAGLHVVVCDELAHYLTWPEKKARDAFAEALRDLVSRGRAAGVIVITATQKPGSDVVPTSIRDLFGYRLAMRCSTPAASDTILGSGWAAEGYSAAAIDPVTRGVGFLLHESGVPAPMRSHWLDDAAIDELAARAARLRGVDDATR